MSWGGGWVETQLDGCPSVWLYSKAPGENRASEVWEGLARGEADEGKRVLRRVPQES